MFTNRRFRPPDIADPELKDFARAFVEYLNGLELPDALNITQATASLRTLGVGAGSPTTGTAQFFVRAMFMQGATVASANNLTLGMDGNRFQVSGTTQINLLSSASWQGGSIVTLHFQGALTVKHNQAVSGTNLPIRLYGGTDFVAAANDQLVLQLDSVTSNWFEISRTTAVATSSSAAGDPSYAPGTFTVATGTAKIMSKRLQLTTTQRATLAGTARLRIT